MKLSQLVIPFRKAASSITELFKSIWRSLLRPIIEFVDAHNSFVTALATVAIAVLTWSYVTYSEKQWKTMQQQLDLSQRPWIEPKLQVTSPLIFENNRWRLDLDETLENHGSTVAMNVLSWNDMFPFKWEIGFGRANRRQKEWCDANRHSSPQSITGYTLFPKQKQVSKTTVGFNEKDISVTFGPKLPDNIGLLIVGCVVYKAPFDAADAPTRQTRYGYLLSISNSDAIARIPVSHAPVNVYLVALPDKWTVD